MASPRIVGGNIEGTKLKGESSPSNNPKNSVVSGLSIISQLSFVKASFSSPNTGPDGSNSKAASQRAFENVTLMQDDSNETSKSGIKRLNTQQATKTELRLRKSRDQKITDAEIEQQTQKPRQLTS